MISFLFVDWRKEANWLTIFILRLSVVYFKRHYKTKIDFSLGCFYFLKTNSNLKYSKEFEVFKSSK